MDCLFCKIIAGEIPSKKIYEDEQVYVFEDIAPIAPVHYLLIPKTHISGASEITAENSAVVAHIFEVIAKIADEKGISDGFRVITNCGDDAGQSVKHLHFHLIAGRKLGWSAESAG
jgi:histidine triad (HIT) family protein